ncbi:MAG TPA: hypothetical protein ENN75_04265 [candidate division Zixibacteria bacterium]|nr:hypothetical protein [candidate division Zixibacteria bacterium]
MLDDAEDLDLIADGVEREWVSDFIWPDGYILNCTTISTLGLTAAEGQTPIGTLTATIPETHDILAPEGWISASFGVPVPATPGVSTATAPADITSFSTLTFFACFDPILEGQEFQVVLETYPEPDYPKIHWFFSPVSGSAFEPVSIDLWSPDLIENADGLTLAELLSQCRYLSFYCFAGPVPLNTRMHFHIDDIRLKSDTAGVPTEQWQGY